MKPCYNNEKLEALYNFFQEEVEFAIYNNCFLEWNLVCFSFSVYLNGHTLLSEDMLMV